MHADVTAPKHTMNPNAANPWGRRFTWSAHDSRDGGTDPDTRHAVHRVERAEGLAFAPIPPGTRICPDLGLFAGRPPVRTVSRGSDP